MLWGSLPPPFPRQRPARPQNRAGVSVRAVVEWQRWPCGGLRRPSEPHAAVGRRGVMHQPRACSFSAPGKRNGRPSLEARGGHKFARNETSQTSRLGD